MAYDDRETWLTVEDRGSKLGLPQNQDAEAPLGCVICLQLGDVAVFSLCAQYFLNVRGGGWYHYPRSVPHVSETLRGRGLKRQTLPLLGLGRGCSQRTQRAFGTAMRLCASLSRGVAAPLGCVIFSVSVEIYGFTPRTQGFLCVRGGGGITTPGVRCVLPKFSAPACQSSLFAVF